MPNSYVDYTVTGNQTSWSSVNLDYLLTSHIGVSITSNASGTVYTVAAADITVTESPNLTVEISSAKYGPSGSVYVVAANDVVRIARTTPIDELTRTFNDGSVLKASDLNAQNNQLLFSLQEQEDKGVGSLPVDTDDRYDAGGRIIKNVATPLTSHHVATYQFVADAIAAGGVQSLDSPESWSLTGNDFTASGSDAYYDFPIVPTSTEAKTFLVEVGGVLQHPADDYTITVNADDSVRLTLLSQSGIADAEKVQVRNFGASRNQAVQPFISSSSAPAMKCKAGDGVSTTNTMEVQNSSGTNLAAFTYDGKLQVGTTGTQASQTEIRSSTSENAVEVGDNSTGNTAGVEVRQDINGGTNDDYGQILVSGQSSANPVADAIRAEKNGSELITVKYSGAVNVPGGFTAGTVTSTGAYTAPAGMNVTGGILNMSGGTELEVNGTLDVNGSSAFSGNITVGGGADLTFGSGTSVLKMDNGSSITMEKQGKIELEAESGDEPAYVYSHGGVVQIQHFQSDAFYVMPNLTANTVTDLEVASGSYIEVTITPKKTTSKIMLDFSGILEMPNMNGGLLLRRKIGSGSFSELKSAVSLSSARAVIMPIPYGLDATNSTPDPFSFKYVDSPATVESVTYRVAILSSGTHQVGVNGGRVGDATNNEYGVTTFIATEIGQQY